MRAIVNIADTGALESTAHMLSSIGYECVRPDPFLIRELQAIGCENVLQVEDLVTQWGYDWPTVEPLGTLVDILDCDLFVDTKAHVNYPRLVRRWPNLEGKILWCCLNGGDPCKRTDNQPWSNPPCPVLTNNQWYAGSVSAYEAPKCSRDGKAYACFPPYMRFHQHRRLGIQGSPICLTHNVERWGYGEMVESLHKLGVKFYGTNSPDGLLPNSNCSNLLQVARCLVHLKIGDTVSYAMMAAMASRCPVIVTQKYVDECRLHELLIDEKTAMVCKDYDDIVSAIKVCVHEVTNQEIGNGGKDQLKRLMWEDVDGFREFMRRNYR